MAQEVDWSKSTFFDPKTELQTTESKFFGQNTYDDEGDSEEGYEFNMDEPDNTPNPPQTIHSPLLSTPKTPTPKAESPMPNPIMNELIQIMITRFEHLVEKGFLNPQFLGKIRNDPAEILRFIRQNRAVVGDQLNRRLNPKIRPTPRQLELKGIVPKGYFSKGHKNAMTRKHRRKSSAAQDLATMISLRPKPEAMVAKGIVQRSAMERYIELDDQKMSQAKKTEKKRRASIVLLSQKQKQQTLTAAAAAAEETKSESPSMSPAPPNTNNISVPSSVNIIDSISQQPQTWDISIVSTLLFRTIAEALRKSCNDTQNEESNVLLQMEEMNAEMKNLRHALDKYFLDDEPDVLLFEKEEKMIRSKFHNIQSKLLVISNKQNAIHDKLRILHSVERKMIDLQNVYDKELGQLRKNEEDVLKDLQEQRNRRDKAIKIRMAEKSHSNWCLAKLDYTINIASEFKEESEQQFVNDLNGFLAKIKQISENQNNIVRDFDFAIDELESHLLSIRHAMSKVRTMTFKKIYDLHKQVEIAESLELGNRRLSVASATEIERERKHFTIKIQRQLSTLKNQVKIFDLKMHRRQLREIMDVQCVMSHYKSKMFFSVFCQCFCQTLCDIDLAFKNLGCFENESKQSKDEKGKSKSLRAAYQNEVMLQNKAKIKQLCMELYGIQDILEEIEMNDDEYTYGNSSQSSMNLDFNIVDKIVHCMKFIQISKNAMLYEIEQIYFEKNKKEKNENVKFEIGIEKMDDIVIIIGRKLSIDDNMMDDIDRTQEEQITKLAQMRVRSVFQYILDNRDLNKMFGTMPLCAMDVANVILKDVFGIDNEQNNDDYFI